MDTSPLYPEALQKIGRNVVELQKLEGMLKGLLVSIEFDGEVSELKTRMTERREAVSKRTMGSVSGELLNRMFSEPIEPKRTTNTGDHWISFQYCHGGSEEYIEEIKKSFEKIVEERNQLIHHRLLSIDACSDVSCKELISYLDDQHARIEPMHDFLRNELNAVKEMQTIFPQILKQLNAGADQSESE